MSQVQIYDDELNTYHTVTMDLRYSVLNDGSGESEWYIVLSTSIPKLDGTSYAPSIIKTLDDVPPGSISPATTFTELMQWWILYYMTNSEFGMSSSSSSSYSSSSSSYSSSSSSEGYSESSSSNSSSSESSSSDSSESSSS